MMTCACQDVARTMGMTDFTCDYVAKDNTWEELKADGDQHGKSAHADMMATMTPEQMKGYEDAMRAVMKQE